MTDALVINTLLGTLLLLGLLHLDKYEKEPLGRVLLLFAGSIVLTAVYGLVKHALWRIPDSGPVLSAFVEAGLLEETFKFAIFLLALWKWRDSIDEPFDCMVYFGIVGLGFAVQENLNYFLTATFPGLVRRAQTGDASLYYAQLRGIVLARAAPVHLMVDMIAGFVVGLGLGRKGFPGAAAGALLLAVVLHGAWNWTALVLGIPALLAYLSILALATAATIALALRASSFRARQEAWLARLEALGRGARPPDCDPDVLADLIRSVKRLAYLGGREQARAFRSLETAMDDRAGRSLMDRVSRARDAVLASRAPVIDASYYVLVGVVFVMVGFVAAAVSWFLGALAT